MDNMDMTEAEVIDLIDMIAQQRYGISGFEFLASYTEGLSDKYPHCEDLEALAEALG